MHKINKKMNSILSFLALAFAYAYGAPTCNYLLYTYSSSSLYIPPNVCVGYQTSSGYNSSYMYSCMTTSTGAYYIAYTGYDNYNCGGNSSSSYEIWANNTNYQFLCSAEDCIVEYEDEYYTSVDDCSGTPYTTTQYGFVAGVCYNISSSGSFVYGCTDDSYTIFTYSDGMCSDYLLKVVYDSGCESYVSTYSSDYSIPKCSKPGYYGIASSQIPAFSTFVSFVMIAIAFFAC